MSVAMGGFLIGLFFGAIGGILYADVRQAWMASNLPERPEPIHAGDDW